MSDTILTATYDDFTELGVAVISNGSVLTNPFWTIKGENK